MSTGSDLIREARRRAGLTQAELAARAGTTQSALARTEAARTAPDFDTVVRLVRLCGLELTMVLTEPDDSDLAQARSRLLLTPGERMERGVRTARRMREMRSAGSGG